MEIESLKKAALAEFAGAQDLKALGKVHRAAQIARRPAEGRTARGREVD
jgi:hypothetical protein